MRLYKMELYKICHKKLFIIEAILVIGIVLITFGVQVFDEEATVDGVRYTGYQAVQVNRRITEEFRGAVTDEKIEKIVEKYGYPHKVEEGWNYFRDANFLTNFVLDYLADGYINNWTDYGISTNIRSIEDSDLGNVMEFTGKEIILEYYSGWKAFLEVLSIGMVMGSILILFSVSAVFAGEKQSRMLPLLFTARKGRDEGKRGIVNDIFAKIAAVFTVAVGVFLTVFLTDIILCGVVYGYDGLDCYNGMVVSYMWPSEKCLIPMYNYVGIAVLYGFLGQLSLCAVTICISAYCKSIFHALAASASAWGAPVLAMMFVNSASPICKFLYSTPVLMVIYRIIEDMYEIWLLPVCVSVIVFVFCMVTAYKRYDGQQVV